MSLGLAVPIGERDHVRGPADAPVTLVEYGDYQCPDCAVAHPVVEEVRRRMGSRLRFVYRHFPLTNAHARAQPAAEAAETAGTLGRFWEMHDRLLAHQSELDDQGLRRHAKAAGLDLDRFETELVSGFPHAKVREDFRSGVRSGVDGTPTFFVNGRRHDGAADVQSLLQAIETAVSGV